MLFFIAGFLFALIIDEKLKLLLSRYLWIGILIGIVIIAPNLIWQYNHAWPVTIHMSELRSSQLELLGYSGFFVSLFAFSQGLVIIWLIGLGALLFFKKGEGVQVSWYCFTVNHDFLHPDERQRLLCPRTASTSFCICRLFNGKIYSRITEMDYVGTLLNITFNVTCSFTFRSSDAFI